MVAVYVEEFLKEGVRDEYVKYMSELIKLTRQEEGNIAYNLFAPADDPAACFMIEVWETKEALDKHMASEHFLKFVPAGDVYKTEPSKIRIFDSL